MLEESQAKRLQNVFFHLLMKMNFLFYIVITHLVPILRLELVSVVRFFRNAWGLWIKSLCASLMPDVRFWYALYITGVRKQMTITCTFGRFCRRCLAYETETAIEQWIKKFRRKYPKFNDRINIYGRRCRLFCIHQQNKIQNKAVIQKSETILNTKLSLNEKIFHVIKLIYCLYEPHKIMFQSNFVEKSYFKKIKSGCLYFLVYN